MRVINRLTVSSYGVHLADQTALVSVPLIAALVFGASPKIIGVLVACQSMAHLLGSLPFGLIVDRAQSKWVAVAATVISAIGFFGASVSVLIENLVWFGVTVTFAGFGVVLFVLVALSILPKVVPADRLAGANAQIEIPRALMSFLVPLVIGVLITGDIAVWIFGLAGLAALGALVAAAGLPRFPVPEQKNESVVRQIVKGGRFVLRHELLLPISLCAIFWNLAFSALLVVAVPLIIDVYRIDPGAFGVALSAFGSAAVAGAWVAGRFSASIPTNAVLLFGPGSSIIAIVGLLLIPAGGPAPAIYASFFLLGFGPSMWLVAQNSVRQLVTPGAMLGCVNSVIQTAIYGMRPVGALLGGLVVGATTPQTGLALVALTFTCSFAAAAFSRLRTVRRYSDLRGTERA